MTTYFKIIPLEERIVLDAAAAAVIYVNVNTHASAAQQTGADWAHAWNNLQSALTEAASASHPEQIWVAQGTYTPGISPTATFTLSNNVSIYGGFAGNERSLSQRNIADHPTILNGVLSSGNIDTIVTINGGTSTLDGLTITGANNPTGPGGGVLEVNGATLTVSNDIFTNNEVSSAQGGGIYSTDSTLTVTNCLFSNNAAVRGGAIGVVDDALVLINTSLFQDNRGLVASNGGEGTGAAVFIELSQNITITSSSFNNNIGGDLTGGIGGAVLVLANQSVNINYDIFDNNSILGNFTGAGAIGAQSNQTLNINNDIFDNNFTQGFGTGGGAIFSLLDQTVNMTNDIFKNNYTLGDGSYGGAYGTYADANVNLSFDIFNNNSAPYGGGAISAGFIGNMHISYCVFNNNTGLGTTASDGASGQGGTGGAIDMEPGMGTTTIDHSIFNNNSAYFAGGAIDTGNNSQSLTITSSIFTNNSVVAQGGQGGAIWDNTAVAFGYTQATANVVIAGNLFVGNSASSGNDIWLDGTESSVNGNPTVADWISGLNSSNLLLDPDAIVIA